MADHKIIIYALSTCSHCKSARKYLEEKGIEFNAYEVDLLQGDEKVKAIDSLKKYNPERSFPTIVINDGEKVVIGFREDKLREALKIS